MKINSINTYTPINTNQNNTPSFNGKIIVKGKQWNDALLEAFEKSEGIKQLASGEKDVIGRLKTKYASERDYNHFSGQTLYKLNVEMRSPKPSFKEKVKSFFGISQKTYLTRHYHSEVGLKDIIHNFHINYLTNCIKKK